MVFKTVAKIKCEIIEPSESSVQAARASIAELAKSSKQTDFIKFAQENKQEDLLYFKAIYATCGFNLNDDVFVKDEFWAARTTPIWKPANVEHSADDIIGVIYAVQAQSLDGEKIDIESDTVPSNDFEIVIYGVVYKYMFPLAANEIKKKSNAGDLYVSMETWFKDFSYALLDSSKNEIALVDRTDKTIGLDKSLRAYGGSGKYDGKRIGRVLRNITFGGVGFVDTPANPGSVGEVQASEIKTETEMIDLKNPEIVAELEKASAAVKAEADKALASVKEELATASTNLDRLSKQLKEAEMAKSISDAILKTAEAGLFADTPSEISKIDNASDKFAAKIAFINQTGKALADKVVASEKTIAELTAKVTELDASIATLTATNKELAAFKEAVEAAKAAEAKAKAEVEAAAAKKAQDEARIAEVLALGFASDVVETLKPNFLTLEKDAYNKWLEEKKVIAAKLTIKKDGGQDSFEQEGKSGEKKAKQTPRDVISVKALLKSAVVEEHVEPSESTPEPVNVFAALANAKKK